MMKGILIINFGSQYTQLIARRIRELNVYSEIVLPAKAYQKIQEEGMPSGIILSGSPFSVYQKKAPRLPPEFWDLDVPVLGICYGMQLIAKHYGAQVRQGKAREYGQGTLTLKKNTCPVFEGVPLSSVVWMSHGDEVTELPQTLNALGKSKDNNVLCALAHKTKPIYALQFHPEVTHSVFGAKILENFVYKVCQASKNWVVEQVITQIVQDVKTQVGQSKVVLGLSGGVDSSVAAVLIHQAIGKNLICIFIDTGLLRQNEAQEVLRVYKNKFNLNIRFVSAGHIFLEALQNISDPEQKRKIIGQTFIKVFEKEAYPIKEVAYLAQGTIYPDVIESAAAETGAQTIKSHHNVGGLPEKMNLRILEPLRYLFKDEVRKMGLALHIPPEVVMRHPFPGPGLAIRIIGNISKERIAILQKADSIFIEELIRNDYYDKVSQAFVVLLPVKSVGVMGDSRTYEYVCALRAVHTIDFMTATWAQLPYELIARVSSRIIGEVGGINRVTYDVSAKPPATIEWE